MIDTNIAAAFTDCRIFLTEKQIALVFSPTFYVPYNFLK